MKSNTIIGIVEIPTPMTMIKILDLDEVSTEEDVRKVFKRDFTTSGLKIKRVKVTKVTLRAQRAAFSEIDEASAAKALKKVRDKVGWVNCRIHLITRVTRCYRCLGYGH